MKRLYLLQCFEVNDAIKEGIAAFNRESSCKNTHPNSSFINDTKIAPSKKKSNFSFLLTKIITLK
jgi:hypothetical protein